MKPGDKLIQSYVLNRYFVSTIFRDSSAAIDPRPYFETMVWPWDADTRQRADQFTAQVDSGHFAAEALKSHFGVCFELAKSLES
jgi:hypothetical protein